VSQPRRPRSYNDPHYADQSSKPRIYMAHVIKSVVLQ
jgi:hypothetical protein